MFVKDKVRTALLAAQVITVVRSAPTLTERYLVVRARCAAEGNLHDTSRSNQSVLMDGTAATIAKHSVSRLCNYSYRIRHCDLGNHRRQLQCSNESAYYI